MSTYTDIYNNGVATYNLASQDKAAADAAMSSLSASISSWSLPPYTGSTPEQYMMYKPMAQTSLEGFYASSDRTCTYHYQKLALDIYSLQSVAMQATSAINQNKVMPGLLTPEEVSNLTSGIAAVNDLISQLQSSQSNINSVRAALSTKYQQLLSQIQ